MNYELRTMKNNVREFYDNIGWSEVADGLYQNSRYEDLRPVSQEYIHRCHMRINRHLAPEGRFLLDAGSGPIQYPDYLTFSRGYTYRVCADMSVTALKEAREKIGDHGLFVVADVANLPFKKDAFDGVVSLHTIHHLPLGEHARAYRGLHRVLRPGKTAVEVNGWDRARLMDLFRSFSELRKRAWLFARRLLGRPAPQKKKRRVPKNTFVEKHNPAWFRRTIAKELDTEILVWRSASVHFLKNYVFEDRGGKTILKWLYALEERFPHFFGVNGAYPMVVIRKHSEEGRDGTP